ncbi:MAG: GNAT family N-acetyltransferase [Betaproteobacteria bacterium]|nr:MAG: GNAT family N-acetyltransferase [Betaproteobacteria bacterium]
MSDAQKIVIRRPDPRRFAAEADTVTALFIEARRTALPKLKVVRSNDETYEWMREVVFPRRSIRIAELEGTIVGFAARDGAWLEHLYVKVGFTGRGIGSELLNIVIGEAKPVTPVLRLYAFQCNAGARRFYERHGFVAVAFGDGTGNEEGEPDVRYERKLR